MGRTLVVIFLFAASFILKSLACVIKVVDLMRARRDGPKHGLSFKSGEFAQNYADLRFA